MHKSAGDVHNDSSILRMLSVRMNIYRMYNANEHQVICTTTPAVVSVNPATYGVMRIPDPVAVWVYLNEKKNQS